MVLCLSARKSLPVSRLKNLSASRHTASFYISYVIQKYWKFPNMYIFFIKYFFRKKIKNLLKCSEINFFRTWNLQNKISTPHWNVELAMVLRDFSHSWKIVRMVRICKLLTQAEIIADCVCEQILASWSKISQQKSSDLLQQISPKWILQWE
jgi:hypothetical protein